MPNEVLVNIMGILKLNLQQGCGTALAVLTAMIVMCQQIRGAVVVKAYALESEGLLLRSADAKEFQTALNPLRDKTGDVLLPYMFLLENQTDRNIIAYSIRWECRDESGEIVPRQVTLYNFADFHGGNAIAPHASRIVSSVPLVGTKAEFPPGFFKHISESEAFFEHQKEVSVFIDLVMFENGKVVGPDRDGGRPRLQAYLDAERDVSAVMLDSSLSDSDITGRLTEMLDDAHALMRTDEPHDFGYLVHRCNTAKYYSEAYRLRLGFYATQLLEDVRKDGVRATVEGVRKFTSQKKYPVFEPIK